MAAAPTYRGATAADADAIHRLFVASFTDTFGHLYRPEDLTAFVAGFTRDGWERELRDPAMRFRLAEADGRLLGYAKIGPQTLPFEPRGPALELRQLYLDRDWHGQGVAQQLMRWVLDEAMRMRAEEVFLSVYIDNERAKRFYARYGFERVGRYDFMVGQHADEDIIMRLAL
ncbi:GNAT family N-acetyltransferase [Sphingomonas ginkgonis]|uniref:GNAT family N-acetyltransferase n=1 Tax=Sphingomonas ginkgonis TaxID=2315330 RepID=A0A3R9WRH9_9SPHN|nr:GNAT family N-acetyltransferase [Sphingomonas ginkgonis]RST30077.1 GNAT family N-acetyltransferase [Sphingomonas ginkgonis]